MPVYLQLGQSNAGDSGIPYPGMAATLLAPQENLYQYRNWTEETTSWEAMQPRPGKVRYFGSEVSFAHAMSQRLGEPVAVVKVSFNGSALWWRWMPDPTTYPTAQNDLYVPTIAKIQQAVGQLAELGHAPEIAGVLWIQGEGDANQLWSAQAYDDNLVTFANALRADVGAPGVPFLYNQLHVNADRHYPEALRESQANALASGDNMGMVNIDDLWLNNDSVHFLGVTQVELGYRFADMLAPSGDFNFDGRVDGADLPLWQPLANRLGDGNSDGVADGADLLLWQRQLTPESLPSPELQPVPEPPTVALTAVFATALTLNYLTIRPKRKTINGL